MKYFFLLCLAILPLHTSADSMEKDINESVVTVPVTVADMYGKVITGKLIVTQFKPVGDGPFPIAIINHGRSGTNREKPGRFRYTDQVRFFIKRGFAVFVPTRLGYGDTGIYPDPEESGQCQNKSYAPMAEAGSIEILAVLDYARQLAYTNPTRVLLVGQSVGGYVTTATAAKNPPGVIAAINFAGGSGGDPYAHPGVPCQGQKLEAMYARFGATSKVPMLWIYTENDYFFSPAFSQAWNAAFVKAGGQAEFKLLPPYSSNGHALFSTGTRLWSPIVAQFLETIPFDGPTAK
ncbi:alpha/beta fold hydrolase [Herbaspirillum sp. RTI4]|uniref:dienelactone hydrolase family protein n=1 Tax=Herbaspirillum sp. RTI4 TaxID=3048640 RepID=UPI002AB421F7|nr:alpha/beta fold hydrolase [Herbaspirillum sp. RTI4]MDY7579658.1 alpha/beta fold hydrolase [Herbaspirillum sp. RTI4]MEA9981873.1 alpha/beta fold hydrolase [Herbaspirillum sp. RTI4]